MNIDSALDKIYSLKQFHIKLGLENISNLLNHLDNPQNKFKSIHVAGSNGKGSTCSFLASILQENGFKVGLYTSPHFVRFNERIRINCIEISDNQIIEFLENNKNYLDEFNPTFFEITTALAFNYFANQKVDFAIIETGLGGRLDATNKIIPIAALITSISLEHTHILGNTVQEIAYEKAGIIKENIPVFIGDLPEEAEKKIKEISELKKSELFKLSDYYNEVSNKLNIKIGDKREEFTKIGLKGKHQLKNAALAIKTLEKVLGINDRKLISKGIDSVVVNTGIQGRYERFGQNGNILFDAAHNLEGISIFIDEFKYEYQKYKYRTLIFGVMRDKEIAKMLLLVSPYFSRIKVTSTKYERAATAEEIKSIADINNISVEIENKPEKLLLNQKFKSKDECIVVLGSIYLLGEIKKKLTK